MNFNNYGADLNYKRLLNLPQLLDKKSFFLFGPRATGKSTLIEQQLPEAVVFDLLDRQTYTDLLKRPSLLSESVKDADQIVVVDEIQKIPSLLDEVHRLIQKKKMKFLLTGSSARRLKRGGANLLAGRAWQAQLFPLVSAEIDHFDLLQYLNRGGLPEIYQSRDAQEELKAYVGTYLKEEIQAEALTRNVPAFAEFLDVVALANGQEINFERFASDCQISTSTLKNYMQILEDMMLGFKLPGFVKTKKRKALARAKHYLFDLGVTNQLCQRGDIREKSEMFGPAFEHFLILELRSYLSYRRSPLPLTYWRSLSKFEVDVLCGQELAIEIKSTELISDKHLRGLRALKEEGMIKRFMAVSCDRNERRTEDGIEILPWAVFLQRLWADKLLLL